MANDNVLEKLNFTYVEYEISAEYTFGSAAFCKSLLSKYEDITNKETLISILSKIDMVIGGDHGQENFVMFVNISWKRNMVRTLYHM